KAIKLFIETRELQKAKLGSGHLDTLGTMMDLGKCYSDSGHVGEALKLEEETLRLLRANYGNEHTETLKGMNNLAVAYMDIFRFRDALKLLDEGLALNKANPDADYKIMLGIMRNMSEFYSGGMRRPANGLRIQEEMLALQKATIGTDDPETLITMWRL